MVFDFSPSSRSAPDAGVPTHCYKPHLGRKSQIVYEETGQVFSNSVCSPASPDYFKSAFESNRDYFTAQADSPVLSYFTQGMESVRLDRDDPKNSRGRCAGQTSCEKQRAADLFCGSKKHDIKSPFTGRIYNQTNCSKDSPQWFKLPAEHNRRFYEKQGNVDEQQASAEATFTVNPKGHYGGPPTGHLCSTASPDWMKASFEDNGEYFKDRGVIHKSTSPEADAFAEYPIGRRVQLMNPDTGKVCCTHVASPKSPAWMKSSYTNDKTYFDKHSDWHLRDPARSSIQSDLKTMRRTQTVDAHTGHMTYRRNVVSTDGVPEWMMPQTDGSPSTRPLARANSEKSSRPSTAPSSSPQEMRRSNTARGDREPRTSGDRERQASGRRSPGDQRTFGRDTMARQLREPAQRSSGGQRTPGRDQLARAASSKTASEGRGPAAPARRSEAGRSQGSSRPRVPPNSRR